MGAQYWRAALVIWILAIGHDAVAQTPSLSLSGGSGAPGANVTLSVSLNANGGTQPSSVQWDFSYSSAVLGPASGTYYATGATASAAGKSATCNTISPGDIRCVVAGMNATPIGNGVVATVTFQIAAGTTATSSPVTLVGSLGSDSSGNRLTITASGATVTINQPPAPLPTSLTCSPASITAPTTSTCTVTLNVAPTSNTSVALSSGSGSASVPASVTVNSGATTANFTVTPSAVSSSTAAVITATLNGTSKTFSLTLLPPAPVQVSSAVPNSAVQGTINLDVPIAGSGFKRGAHALWFVSGTTNPGGVTVNSTAFVSSAQLTANVTVSSIASVSSFDITVTNTNGSSGKGTGLFSVTGAPTCTLSPLPSQFALATTLNSNTPTYTGSFGVSMRVRPVTLGGQEVLVAAIGSGASGKLEIFFLDPVSGTVLDNTNLGVNTQPQPHITIPITLSKGNTFGARAIAMGDVNNDGVPDIVAGDWDFGVAFAFVGQVDGNGILSYSNQISLTASGSSARFGRSVAAGDLDGLPGDEVVVGDSGFGKGGHAVPGQVFIFKFNSATTSFSVVKTISAAGWGVAIGDVAGDSTRDLIVATGSNIVVYPGSIFSSSPPAPITLAVENSQVAAANVDAAPANDLVVATGADVANVDVLKGPVFSGEAASIVLSAESGFTSGWGTGFDVGDINGDGLADVIVGAPNTSPSTACPANVGSAYIYLSNASNPAQPVRYLIEAPTLDVDFAAYGYGIAAAPGFRIFLIGESGRNINGVTNAGQVYVYKVN
jgi:Cohesin domain/FG-GAP repeat